jgi:DNA-binding NarL/FixJ family response regulator
MDEGNTRVCIIAGYASARAGLHALLADAPGVSVVGAVEGSGEPLARLLPGMKPDALLLDTSGEGSGDSVGELLALLGDADPPPGVVVLGDTPERDVSRLADSDLPGWAYLLREADGPQIGEAVRGAAVGLMTLDRSLAPRLAELFAAPEPALSLAARADPGGYPGDALTPREIEVLQLMAEGLPNKIIAARLKVSLHTAKFHVAQILGKLDATSRTEAVTTGARRGYVML